jgi:hypothetical protein
MTLSSMNTSKKEVEDRDQYDFKTPTNRHDWNMPMMLLKYRQSGKEGVVRALRSSGFSSQEIGKITLKLIVVNFFYS